MSWSDDIRCLYCDGRLPLYRKITNGQFCSTAHRKAYWAEQERLAVERLHQTHDSLRAYRPKGPIEAILGQTEPEPEPAPVVVEMPQPEERPWWMPQVNAGEIPMASFVADPVSPRPRWMEDRLAGAEEQLIELPHPLRRPVNIYPPFDCGFSFAPPVPYAVSAAPGVASVQNRTLNALPVAVWPIQQLSLGAVPETKEMEPVEQDPAPLCETSFALALPQQPVESRAFFGRIPEPIATGMRAQLPLDSIRLNATLSPAFLFFAGLRELPVDRIAMIPGPWIDGLRAIDCQAGSPQFVLATPPLRPRLQLAAGRRYAVESREPAVAPGAPQIATFPTQPPVIALPGRQAKVLRATASAPAPVTEPNPTGLLPIACAAPVVSQSALAVRPAPTVLSLPQPPRPEPMRPSSKLEPIDAKPVADTVFAPPPVVSNVVENPATPAPASHEKAHVWVHAIDFWNRAPRDLKVLMVAIPLLLGLALHPSLPKVRVTAPSAAGGFQKNFKNVVNHQWGSVRQTLLDRAAIALDEDFRSGLDEWVSRGDATTDWSFDATGFVRPGPLAMYRPSMNLTDYQMQFLGMIDKKALSWVVRAADFDNYYVIKMVVLKSGPLPTIGITRYAVINGKADSRGDTVVPVDARADSLYRVRLDVHGDDFALSVQGQMVDSWSESRLTRGGIGFFAAPGEESRVRWVQVTHQYDMLGRLCAYLAPYNITSTSGSWQQQ